MATKKRTSGERTKVQFPGASEVPDPETPALSMEERDTIQRDYQERKREERRQEIHQQLLEIQQRLQQRGRVR